MSTQLRDVSLPARVADSTEEIGMEELALAARDHGMPLEALRYNLTPFGLHYSLIHYDIPYRAMLGICGSAGRGVPSR